MATLTAVHLPVANSAHTFQERVPLGDALWGEFGTDEAALEEGVGRCLLSEVARLHLLAVNAPVEAATHPQPRHGCLLRNSNEVGTALETSVRLFRGPAAQQCTRQRLCLLEGCAAVNGASPSRNVNSTFRASRRARFRAPPEQGPAAREHG
uniref:Uncharacterized protein n=1 Tax=Rhipicephalus zambeziensis TaxID=60191 RepID=A0A224YBF1_9ACAR